VDKKKRETGDEQVYINPGYFAEQPRRRFTAGINHASQWGQKTPTLEINDFNKLMSFSLSPPTSWGHFEIRDFYLSSPSGPFYRKVNYLAILPELARYMLQTVWSWGPYAGLLLPAT